MEKYGVEWKRLYFTTEPTLSGVTQYKWFQNLSCYVVLNTNGDGVALGRLKNLSFDMVYNFIERSINVLLFY